MPAIDVRVVGGGNNTWSHVFQGANTTWIFNQLIRVGNFYIGLPAMSQQMFDAQIPPGSIIDSATMTVEARNTNAGAMTIPLKAFDRDTYYSEPLILPFSSHTGFRRDYWSNAGMGALSTTFTAISGSASSPTNASWILRQINGWRDRMWQLTPTRTGNMELDFGIWEMLRTGNPIGSCRMRIQGVQTDKYGQNQPDGVDVAVSSDVLLSTIALGPTVTTVAFTFPGNEVLTAETDYFWGLEVDYTANNADHVSARHHNAFFNDGQLYHEGTDTGMVWQNFPGQVDLSIGANGFFDAALATVNWVVPNFVANTTYVTPDITTLIQAQVNQPWYTQDSGILIACPNPSSGLVSRVYKSPAYPAIDRARLLCTYHDRRIMIT